MRSVFVFAFVVCTSLLVSRCAFSQTGYKIDFKINGWKDSVVYLGHYFNDNTYIKDTAQVKPDGTFTFQKKEPLLQGVYFLVRKKGKNNAKIFDFVIGQDQTFSMETSDPKFMEDMKVKGDEDNKLYFENIAYNIERNKEAEPFSKILKDSASTKDQKKTARDGYAKLNDKVIAHQRELVAKYPTTMTARMLNASLPIVIPDAPKKANGNIDSTFQLKYYREHFFDNFDLSDEAMLRLPQPIYKEKLKEYVEKLYVPQPDSVTKAINFVVVKAKKNKETYYYTVWNYLVLYQMPDIMGLDEVFVNLYDQYIKTGEMDYRVMASTKNQLKEHADKIRSSMIGRVGSNLYMQDANLQPRIMFDIKNKYTILYIFSPTCGHCREETPKLVKFYNENKTKYDFEVYAVALDTSMKAMKDFIKEFKTPWITVNGPRYYQEQKKHVSLLYHADTTPTIYILDDKKTIIAKKIPVKQLDDFLSKHEKFLQAKKKNQNLQPQKVDINK